MKLSIVPGRGLAAPLSAWLAVAILALALPAFETVWLAMGAAIGIALLAAALEVRGPLGVTVERRVAHSLPVGAESRVTLRLNNASGRDRVLEVFDHHPSPAGVDGLPFEITVPDGQTIERAYGLRPLRRGNTAFEPVEVWHRSRFDLLRRRHRLGPRDRVRILPDFRPILLEGLVGVEEQMARLGVHLQRRRGEGLEFEELRDYRQGDSLRQVDWKATARRGSLIARQYQDERNQHVVLMLDCGRRMHAIDDELSHFDHVLNASLLLAYIAVRQGDAIGMQAFGGEDRWLPPVRGKVAPSRLLEALHDLRTANEPPDYAEAVSRLMLRLRRRALVVLVTNLRDEDAEDIVPAVHALRRRHLVLVASNRELELGRLRGQEVVDHATALEVGATHLYLAARRRAHERARSAGAHVFDVEPPALPYTLVSKYLDIKRAGLL